MIIWFIDDVLFYYCPLSSWLAFKFLRQAMSLGAGRVGLQLHAFCSFSLAFASVLKCSLFLNKLVYDYNLDHWVRLLAISHLATSFLAANHRISWWHGRLVGGRHSICGNTQWYTASLWLDFFGKNWSQFDDGWHCLSPPSCSIGTEIVMLVLYTQKHVARQPLTVCYWYFTHIFDWL